VLSVTAVADTTAVAAQVAAQCVFERVQTNALARRPQAASFCQSAHARVAHAY
jgi:hypothetical protein